MRFFGRKQPPLGLAKTRSLFVDNPRLDSADLEAAIAEAQHEDFAFLMPAPIATELAEFPETAEPISTELRQADPAFSPGADAPSTEPDPLNFMPPQKDFNYAVPFQPVLAQAPTLPVESDAALFASRDIPLDLTPRQEQELILEASARADQPNDAEFNQFLERILADAQTRYAAAEKAPEPLRTLPKRGKKGYRLPRPLPDPPGQSPEPPLQIASQPVPQFAPEPLPMVVESTLDSALEDEPSFFQAPPEPPAEVLAEPLEPIAAPPAPKHTPKPVAMQPLPEPKPKAPPPPQALALSDGWTGGTVQFIVTPATPQVSAGLIGLLDPIPLPALHALPEIKPLPPVAAPVESPAPAKPSASEAVLPEIPDLDPEITLANAFQLVEPEADPETETADDAPAASSLDTLLADIVQDNYADLDNLPTPDTAQAVAAAGTADGDEIDPLPLGQGITVLQQLPLTDEFALFLITHQQHIALMVDNGESTALIKRFDALPDLAGMSVAEQSAIGNRRLFLVQVGTWQGVIALDSDLPPRLQTELTSATALS